MVVQAEHDVSEQSELDVDVAICIRLDVKIESSWYRHIESCADLTVHTLDLGCERLECGFVVAGHIAKILYRASKRRNLESLPFKDHEAQDM